MDNAADVLDEIYAVLNEQGSVDLSSPAVWANEKQLANMGMQVDGAWYRVEVEKIDERGIREFSARGIGNPNIYYVEGNSPAVDVVEGGGNWFCFEDTLTNSVRTLRKLGFTMAEITAARRREGGE